MSDPLPPKDTPAPATLLDIDDLAERWKVTRERAFRRIRNTGLKAINLGTSKYPELRFRLATVADWEAAVETPVRDFEPDETPAPQREPMRSGLDLMPRVVKKKTEKSFTSESRDVLGEYRGR